MTRQCRPFLGASVVSQKSRDNRKARPSRSLYCKAALGTPHWHSKLFACKTCPPVLKLLLIVHQAIISPRFLRVVTISSGKTGGILPNVWQAMSCAAVRSMTSVTSIV